MNCAGVSSLHDGLDPRAVRLGLSKIVRVACAGCRHGFSEQGLVVRIVERRMTVLEVEHERRERRPAWLQRLTARDETGMRR